MVTALQMSRYKGAWSNKTLLCLLHTSMYCNRTKAPSPCLQAAYAVANQCSAMVSTVEARETPRLHGPVDKFRSDINMELQKEKYLKVVLNRLGWSRHPSSLSVEDVCKVGQPASGKQAHVMNTAVLAGYLLDINMSVYFKHLLPKDLVRYSFTNFCIAGHSGLLAKRFSFACQAVSTSRFQICKCSLGRRRSLCD